MYKASNLNKDILDDIELKLSIAISFEKKINDLYTSNIAENFIKIVKNDTDIELDCAACFSSPLVLSIMSHNYSIAKSLIKGDFFDEGLVYSAAYRNSYHALIPLLLIHQYPYSQDEEKCIVESLTFIAPTLIQKNKIFEVLVDIIWFRLRIEETHDFKSCKTVSSFDHFQERISKLTSDSLIDERLDLLLTKNPGTLTEREKYYLLKHVPMIETFMWYFNEYFSLEEWDKDPPEVLQNFHYLKNNSKFLNEYRTLKEIVNYSRILQNAIEQKQDIIDNKFSCLSNRTITLSAAQILESRLYALQWILGINSSIFMTEIYN